MKEEDVFLRVCEAVVRSNRSVEPGAVNKGASLVLDLGIDSMHLAALVGGLNAAPAAEGEADAVEIVNRGPVMPGDAVRIVGPGGEDLPERAGPFGCRAPRSSTATTATRRRRFGVRPDRVVPMPPRSIPKMTSGKVRRGAPAGSLGALDKLAARAPAAGAGG